MSTSVACWHRPIRLLNPRSKPAMPRVSRGLPSLLRRASSCTFLRASRARAGSSKSARSAATARFGLRAPCRKMAGLSRSSRNRALPQIAAEGGGPFDLSFIDADKRSIPEYFQFALRLSRPGSLIIIDNVIREGRVLDTRSHDPDIQGIRRFIKMAAREPRVCATAIQTVGSKGHDGFAAALVIA